MADSAAWTLDKIEPPDNTFRDSPEDVHRAFWRYIASIGVDRFHWRCNHGLGANGQPLTGIAASTRARGRKRSYTGLGNANNPPLVPALGLSRTEALLKGRGFVDHAEWYWTTDPVTGLHWGQVMLWHAAGGGGRYPARNVIGWSQADKLWLHAQGQTWWYAHQHGVAVARAMNEVESRADKFPRTPGVLVGKFKVTGRVDVENFTFGIGGTESMVRRSIEEGYFSGFRRLGERKPPGGGKVAKPKPPPKAPAPKPVAKRAAMKQAKPKPEPAHPGPMKLGQVQAKLKETASQEAENKALGELIAAHRLPEVTTGAFHGMTHEETFHSFELEGLRWHFLPIGQPTEDHPVYQQLRNLAYDNPIPEALSRHTRNIYLSTQRNKDDAFWAQKYNIPDAVSSATGGNGDIVAYNGRALDVGEIAHEMGHNLAKSVWRNTNPQIAQYFGRAEQAQPYVDAMKSAEPPVSKYATVAPAEDFAEAVRVYAHDSAFMKEKYPLRAAAIKDLLAWQPPNAPTAQPPTGEPIL